MAALTERKFEQICDAVYEAAAFPELWPKALAKLAWGFDADSARFLVWNKASGAADFVVTARADLVSERSYAQRWAVLDPVRQILEHQLVGTWVLNHKLFSEAFLDQHPYYREFLTPLGLRYTADSRVHEDPEHRTSSIFAVGRRQGREPFDSSRFDQASAVLTPHLARAAKLHHKLAPARVRGRLTEGALDLLSYGIVVNGPDGRVVLANRAALALFEGRNGLTIRDGVLCPCDGSFDPMLKRLLRDGRQGGSLLLPRAEGPPLALTIAPLPSATEWPSLGGDPGTLVLICDRATKAPVEIAGTLRSLFGLSAAEARVACFLARGLSATEAADRLHVSEGTVRSQLKQVFAKMNVSRQSELAAAVLDFDHLRAPPNGTAELQASLRPG